LVLLRPMVAVQYRTQYLLVVMGCGFRFRFRFRSRLCRAEQNVPLFTEDLKCDANRQVLRNSSRSARCMIAVSETWNASCSLEQELCRSSPQMIAAPPAMIRCWVFSECTSTMVDVDGFSYPRFVRASDLRCRLDIPALKVLHQFITVPDQLQYR
jgi:hypothetical protein